MCREIVIISQDKEQIIDKINKRIGLRIMKRRNRMIPKMSQKQLGEEVGVSHSQIARYERGEQHTPGARLVLIAEALGTTVSYFVGIDEIIEENGSLSLEEREATINLMEYFKDIGLPEVREAILEHVERISKISFNTRTEYKANEA